MTFVEFMIGRAGRVLRVAAGVALALVGLLAIGGAGGVVLAVVGLVAIIAGAVNVCLAGPLFGADMWGHPRTRRPSAG